MCARKNFDRYIMTLHVTFCPWTNLVLNMHFSPSNFENGFIRQSPYLSMLYLSPVSYRYPLVYRNYAVPGISRPPRLIPLGRLGPASSATVAMESTHTLARARLPLREKARIRARERGMKRERKRERKEEGRVSSRYTATAVSHGGFARGWSEMRERRSIRRGMVMRERQG